ncbi:ankyrin repeat domain-containing protein [Rodentibacter pneumotropicus]|uniref:ankyrin repeat domain-containing protein n=1 Tax=Rodentibacter pneumotropicus TaxID=758 RepID=UPI002117394C|nr:ankyrin repeat domain-containing protein [Rodentibacter pneumotropicus]
MVFSNLDSESIDELIVNAEFENNIPLLREIFIEKKMADIHRVSNFDKRNYLHSILCYFEPSSELVIFYIKQGLDINAQDIYGMTPLHYAMQEKNVDAAIALLNAGADPNIPNIDNLTPLSLIGYLPDRLDVLELMLEKGANVNYLVNEGETILESYKPNKDEAHLLPIYNLMKKYKDRNNL